MFSKKNLVFQVLLVLVGFVGVSAAQDGKPACYTLASLYGSYGSVGTYGSHVAIGIGTRQFDGNGNLTGSVIVNAPDPTSNMGGRKLTTAMQAGTYTVNCDGTGVFDRILTVNGTQVHQFDDFVITASKVTDDGKLIATEIEDAQRTPSVIVAGGIFLTRHFTRRETGGDAWR